jgi:hypothetical protein
MEMNTSEAAPPFDIEDEDFPPEFIKRYGTRIHSLVEATAEMASKGEVDNIMRMAKLMERIINAGMLVIEESKKQEGKSWAPRWVR